MGNMVGAAILRPKEMMDTSSTKRDTRIRFVRIKQANERMKQGDNC